jgi:sugar O-acyltransferase (sialic acid O-acetyltransferase NeuD family)
MVRDLVIYGAGGFGRETALLVHQINGESKQWNLIGFLDDSKPAGTIVDEAEVLGDLAFLSRQSSGLQVVVAIADPFIRKHKISAFNKSGLDFPVLIHPSALTGSTKHNHVGAGSIITAGCIFTTGITVGNFCIVNLGATLGHDVRLGDYSSIMPGCNISGNVSIGECSMIGTGSQILQNLTIGKRSRVGAGAVVTEHVEDDVTVVGVPARKI